jgi:hypothetical protein
MSTAIWFCIKTDDPDDWDIDYEWGEDVVAVCIPGGVDNDTPVSFDPVPWWH